VNNHLSQSSQADELAALLRFNPDLLRSFLKHVLNRFMVTMFRLGLGSYVNSPWGGYIMVITTTGRKSGLPRRTPVNFLEGDDEVYCLAGFGERSDWYRNLRAKPEVQVWVGGRGWAGRAEVVTDAAEWRPIYRRIVVDRAGFADRAFTKVNYSALDDEQLEKVAGLNPVIRIRLDRPLPRGQGPGDLAFVWPVTGAALYAGFCLGRRFPRRRRS
jgi:deazaflavin-dependent oxidoreductase (nitroreductase family)